MATTFQRVLIGTDPSNPDFTFENDNVISVEGMLSCAVGGENLAVDTLTPEVQFEVKPPEIFVPKGIHTFKGFGIAEGKSNLNYIFETQIKPTYNFRVEFEYCLKTLDWASNYSATILGFRDGTPQSHQSLDYLHSIRLNYKLEDSEHKLYLELTNGYSLKNVAELPIDMKPHKVIWDFGKLSYGQNYYVGDITVDGTVYTSSTYLIIHDYQNFKNFCIFGINDSDDYFKYKGCNTISINNIKVYDSNTSLQDFRLRHSYSVDLKKTKEEERLYLTHIDYTNQSSPVITSETYSGLDDSIYSYNMIEHEPTNSYLGILTRDNFIFCGHFVNTNIQELTFGTPIWYYVGDHLVGEFYVDTIERSDKKFFKINAVSLIGVLDKQESYGGIYFGERFDKVIKDIIKPKITAPYAAADYIISTGEQYINTYLQSDRYLFINGIHIKFSFTEISSTEQCILGSSWCSVIVTSTQIKREYIRGGEGIETITSSYSFQANRIYEMICGENNIIIIDTVSGLRTTVCEESYSDSSLVGSNLFIFAYNTSGTPSKFCKANLYYFKIGGQSGYRFNGLPYRKEEDSTGVLYDSPIGTEIIGTESLQHGSFYGSSSETPFDVYPVPENEDDSIDEIDIEYEEGLDSMLVYGYLPAATKRENLYAILYAYGINIIKKKLGGLLFTTVVDVPTKETNDDFTYDEGSINYFRTIDNVKVTEHEYYDSESSSNILFDNTDSPGIASYLKLKFSSAPIVYSSLQTTGTLQIHEANVNYAVVSGKGKLLGRPYSHTTKEISKWDVQEEAILKSNIPSVTDNTMINANNSSGALERLWNYKSAKFTANGSLVYSGERCGDYIVTKMPFYERIEAFIEKMTLNVSATVKADLELIVGYKPVKVNNGFTTYVILTGEGIWEVPEGITKIRALLIGGGSGGSSGFRGKDGAEGTDTHTGPEQYSIGGEGGEPGEGGSPGYVNIIDIDIDSLESSYIYSCGIGGHGGIFTNTNYIQDTNTSGSYGTHTTFGSYSTRSSDGGYIPENGIGNFFTGDVYASFGANNGIKGGHGGILIDESSGINFADGESVGFNGFVYNGGKGHLRYKNDTVQRSGAYNGGGGAAVGNDGNGGGPYSPYSPVGIEGEYPTADNYRNGGNGASPIAREPETIYGNGGPAGHGGGGGGSSGYYHDFQGAAISGPGNVGLGGYGGDGGDGAPGAIIIYY